MSITSKIDYDLGLYVWYHPRFLRKRDADGLYRYLDEHIEFEPPEATAVRMSGRTIPIPRQQVAYGDEGISYHFTGTRTNTRGWKDDLVGEKLYEVKKAVELASGHRFNFVLVNKYRDGRDYIGYHKDDSRDLLEERIATVSLGETRDFLFRHDGGTVQNYQLRHGSLLMIEPPTNRHWKHSVPKRAKARFPRISLTFRRMRDPPSSSARSPRSGRGSDAGRGTSGRSDR